MYPKSMFLAKIRKKYQDFSYEIFTFYNLKKSLYIAHGRVFVMTVLHVNIKTTYPLPKKKHYAQQKVWGIQRFRQ